MKSVAILLAFLAPTLAKPNGFYHQEYNYQTSSSSYKNHELQHRNDDEGYYSKDGDLEGRLRPRVNAHSQHSEYVNPKMQQGYRIGTDRTSSFGQLHAQNRYRFGEPPLNPEMGAGFGSIGPHQEYGVRSNLRDITGGLQTEMERELQRAVYEQYQRAAAYGGTITQAQIEEDRRVLEEELRRNVTMRLQEALKVHYGNQGIRGAYSYSIMDGRLQPTANYNNQELIDLRRQMEENLMRHLNQQVQTTYHTRVETQVHTTRNTYRGVNGDNYPSPIQQRPVVYHQYPPIQPPPHPQPQPHPVPPIPDSITTVATRVQTELNEILNKILEDTQRRYFAENSYHSGVNYDVILAQLQNELRNNITFHFDDQIKRAYGYTNYASKYSVEDIENLRRQIETNLITKLNRDFNRQREKFFRTQQIYVAPRPIPANHVFYPVPVNNINQHTEIAAMQTRLQEQLSRQLQDALMRHSYRQAHMYTGAANYNPQANYEATLQQLSTELNRNLTRQMEMINMQQFQSGGAYEAQIANMRNQLQHDLMRQLQQGLQQSYSRYSSWSSSSSSSSNANYRPVRGFDPNLYRADLMGEDCMMGDDPSVYQQQGDGDENLTQQTEQLNQEPDDNRDLTRQTQELNQQETLDDEDLTQQTEQLNQEPNDNDDLTQQSQQLNQQETLDDDDLTQQTQSHDLTQQNPTYSSKWELVRQNEDLSLNQPGSPNIQKPFAPVSEPPIQRTQYRPVYHIIPSTHRSPPPVYAPVYNSQSQDLTQHTQTLYPEYQRIQSLNGPVQEVEVTQQIQHPQLYQASPSRATASQKPLQQVWPNREPQHNPTRAYTSTYDWTPQRRYPESRVGDRIRYYENLNSPQTHYRRWKPLNQQTQDIPRGQQVDNSDLTQQIQDVSGQYQENDDLTQQIQDPGFGKLQIGNQQRPVQVLTDQQTRDLTRTNPFLNQQTQDLTRPSQYLNEQTQDLTQQTQDLNQRQDLTQQSQDLTAPNQYLAQQTQDLTRPNQDLTQQTQDLTQQSQDLTAPDQYLAQQTQDLTRPSQNYLDQQTQDRARQRQVLTPYQDLTQQTQDLTRARQDLTAPNQYLAQEIQDLTRPNQYLNQQTQDLTQQTQDLNQQQDLIQQTEDLTQQTQDLTRPNQYYLDQGTQDRTRQRQGLNQYQDSTQQSRDLTRPNLYLNQQTRDLTRPSQDFNQYNDLTQQTEEFNKPNQHSQQTQDLARQTDDLNQYQDLTQQTQDQDLPRLNQYLDQQTQDLTQQTQDLTQHTEDLREPNQHLDQQTQDLTQQTQDLTQQTEDLTQETEDLRKPNQRLDQQTQDLTHLNDYLNQQTQDSTQKTEDLTESNQQTQYLNQQTQDLTQQTEDLTQQTEDDGLTQQIQDPDYGKSQLGDQRTPDLVQQQAKLLTDQQEQEEDVDQPIEAQISTNKIFGSEPGAKQVAQQTQDLIQQEINQNHEQTRDTLPQQRKDSVTTEENNDEQNLTDADRRSQHLIDLLKRQRNQDSLNVGPMQYHPQPVYTELHGQQVQVGTTRQLPYDSGRKILNPPSYAQQVEETESNTETLGEIEPIEPQVASEVQQVGDAQEPDVTTKKPGWWSRQVKKFKNKLGYYDDKL